MNQELDDLLCKKYPKIFAERHLSEMQTCMYWGFSHADGWFNIIDQLCANIQNHIDWKAKNGHVVPQVVAEQVKEKFGTLRFYYRGGDEVIDGMVRMAESMSGVTCEECGAPGVTGGQGWIKTLCETHRK
jgi:hypothetical protein